MTNYGLPLRFKAVVSEDETGRYLGLCSNVFPQEGGLNDGFYSHCHDETGNQLTVDFSWPERIKSKISVDIYQSTGHTDANGTEAFFGDVLLFGGTAYVVSGSDQIELIKAEIVTDEGDEMLNTQYPWGSPVFGLKIEECVCIGNIHTPTAELRRRERERRR